MLFYPERIKVSVKTVLPGGGVPTYKVCCKTKSFGFQRLPI